jgi:hypothetical protein
MKQVQGRIEIKDKAGFLFERCIFLSCQNVDSGVRVYASGHDSHITFVDFFNKIMEANHGVKVHAIKLSMSHIDNFYLIIEL